MRLACRFWFYGDDPVDGRLAKLAEYLDAFEPRADIESLVPVQPLFSEPQKVVNYYAAGQAQVSPGPALLSDMICKPHSSGS